MSAWLKSYVISVLTASVICTVADCLLPEGSIRKYARFALAVILSTVLITPLLSGDPVLPEFSFEQTAVWDCTDAVTQAVHAISGFENARVTVIENGGKVEAITVTVPEGTLLEKGERAAGERMLKNLLAALCATEPEKITITEGCL